MTGAVNIAITAARSAMTGAVNIAITAARSAMTGATTGVTTDVITMTIVAAVNDRGAPNVGAQ